MSKKIRPTHPGELLREEILPNIGMNQSQLAKHLEVSRRTISELCLERRPVSPDIAIRLARAFNMHPSVFLNMQTAVDIWDAEHANGEKYSKIKPLKAA